MRFLCVWLTVRCVDERYGMQTMSMWGWLMTTIPNGGNQMWNFLRTHSVLKWQFNAEHQQIANNNNNECTPLPPPPTHSDSMESLIPFRLFIIINTYYLCRIPFNTAIWAFKCTMMERRERAFTTYTRAHFVSFEFILLLFRLVLRTSQCSTAE